MKVAITQPKIVFGGRIKVLLGITESLNSIGIVPVWVTGSLPGSQSDILAMYRSTAEFRVQVLDIKRFRSEYGRIQANKSISKWCEENQIEWLVNSSNTVQGFTNFMNVISYVHYPREARAASELANIHDLNSTTSIFKKEYWRKALNRAIFAWGAVEKDHKLIANSEFTLDAWNSYYKNPKLNSPSKVIYPFADDPISAPQKQDEKLPVVATLGRFCRAKRQHEQIEIAQKVKDLDFWLMGHANVESPYFKSLKRKIERENIHNVLLLPNLPFAKVNDRLRKARYFVHTNINEPFGITTVEAILENCVPIVHDSGGQKEVVSINDLRYQQLTEIVEILARLEHNPEKRFQWVDELRRKALQSYIRKNFVKVFSEYFKAASGY